jgi:hypothetical protein
MERHFSLRCPSCGQQYLLILDNSRTTLKSILAAGARCTNSFNSSGTGRCGAPLARSQSVNRQATRVTARDLLGYRVVRPHLLDDAATAQAAAQAKQTYEQRIAELETEVARLKEKYETPCSGLVKHFDPHGEHFDMATRERYNITTCGGFLGHIGYCAEVV